MRRPIPVAALILALASGSALAAPEKSPAKAPAKSTKATSTVKPAAKDSAGRTRSELKPEGVPVVKETVLTPEQIKAQQAEWKRLEAKERAERKARREQFRALVATMKKEGVTFQRGDKPNTYRLIAPALAKTSDAARRKASAKALATRYKGQMEPILNKKITLEVYADAKATRRLDH